MKKLLVIIDKIKLLLKNLLIASDSDPKVVRAKHIRLGFIVTGLFLLACFLVLELGESGGKKSKRFTSNTNQKDISSTAKEINIEQLAKGVSNEKIWLEEAEKDLEGLKAKQAMNEQDHNKFREQFDQNKVSKEELAQVIQTLEATMEEKYNQRLAEELSKVQLAVEEQQKPASNQLESKSFKSKIKIKRVGDYIPASSYAKAELISGVDAPVGVTSAADPEALLMRITGNVITAGDKNGAITTDRLIGCVVSGSVTGNISTEKGKISLVSMTCKKDANTVIELPVKGYVTHVGKSGVRGQMVNREGDLVLKSFLSGIASGFGGGISMLNQPQMALSSGGMLMTDQQKAKNIAMGGLGAGAAKSADTLSEYFIKKAEQFQPVISVNQASEVEIVFQEGFSLKEEADEKNSK